MEATFNLLDQPFIPVKGMDEVTKTVSIRDALVNASHYQRVSAHLPHANAALMRLLLAILHRVFGPADSDAWNELWLAQCFNPQALDTYFSKVRPRFDLFDSQHPFYQQRHPQVEEKPAQALLQAIGGGDTFTLFDHCMDESPFTLSPADAAVLLITAQAFSLAGLCHPQLKLVYTDAPCSRAVVFLAEGKNLFETLMFNLVRYNPQEPGSFTWRYQDDPPAWEMDDPYHAERSLPDGYLDYLTWQNRKIQLIPEEKDGQLLVTRVTTAPGLTLNASVRNPMHHYTKLPEKKKAGEDSVRVLRFSEGRALWRDSYALLDVNNRAVDVPRAVSWLSELMGDGILPRRKIQLAAYGMCTEPGKMKVNFYRSDRLIFDDAILTNEQLVGYLNQALTHAENLRRELWSILNQLARLALDPDAAEDDHTAPPEASGLVSHWDGEGLYWNGLETAFYRFLDRLADDPEGALHDWDLALRTSARAAYDATVRGLGNTPRALKAAAKTGGRLGYALNKVLGDLSKEG